MIPKTFHFIWVGDESRRPDNCIETWRRSHPGWNFRLWGNSDLEGRDWVNGHHIARMREREWNGVADMMRWEILLEHGGIVFDADSVCARPLDESLLDCEAFACWESEIARPGLIAAGYFGCAPGNRFVARIIEDIKASETVVDEMAWKTVGPLRLTECYRKFAYTPLRIYPSHYFIPRHFTGVTYAGSDPVYAHQLWGSTLNAYEALHKADVSAMSARPAGGANRTMQTQPVSTELAGFDLENVLRSLLAGQRVLHIDCREELHLALEAHCAILDGVQPDAEIRGRLRPLARGMLYAELAKATDTYDVVIVPEALAGKADPGRWLAALATLDANLFFLAVPDALSDLARGHTYDSATGLFHDPATPGQRHWYSPRTFACTIADSPFTLERMWFLEQGTLLALLSKPDIKLR